MHDTAQSNANNSGISNTKSFFFLEPAAVRKYASDLRATNSAENIELADLLDATPDSAFAPSENQKKLGALIEKLQSHNAPEEIIRDFIHAMLGLVYNRAIKQLSSSMDGDIRAYWDEIMQTNPNEFQIIALLNFYTKVAFEQEIDEYIDTIIAEVVEEYSAALEKDKAVNINLMNLPQETMSEVNRLLAAGEVDQALVLMYQNNSQLSPEQEPEAHNQSSVM